MLWGAARISIILGLLLIAGVISLRAADNIVIENVNTNNPVVHIPHIASAPKLADFEGFQPSSSLAKSMVMIDQFVVREPAYPNAMVAKRFVEEHQGK
jgi:hypothetical protein